MDGFRQDLRYAFRMLRKNPGFLTVAVLSLGLGIGANTAIFSLINAIMLRLLPVSHPEQLVLLTDPGSGGMEMETTEHGVRALLSYAEFEQLRADNSIFSGLFAAQSFVKKADFSTSGAIPKKAHAQLVSGEFFQVLGLQAALGRVFTPQEDSQRGANPVAVISDGFWQREFAGDPGAIGKTIRVGPATLQVIGVAPRGFRGILVGSEADIWAPITMQEQILPGRDYLTPRDTLWLQVMGRLAPGIPVQKAQAAVNVEFQQILRGWAAALPTEKERRTMLDQKILLQPGAKGASRLRDQFSEPLLLLMAMVGLVLLIACANIANLMLARATRRQREFGVRVALGASRARTVQQVLTESLLLAAIGGIAGSILASWGTKLLVALVGRGTNAVDLDVHSDLRVFLFTAVISLLTGIGFGLAPALRTTRIDVNRMLAANARGSIGGQSKVKAGKALVVAQVSLSLLLLIGATLFVRSLHKMLVEKLGFNRDHILMIDIDAVAAGYKGAALSALYPQILAKLGTIPGVRAVSLSDAGLFDGDDQDPISLDGTPVRNPADLRARWTLIGPNYFTTVGIPLLRGREIDAADAAHASQVCVVNQSFARFFFPDSSPIGHHVTDEYPSTRETYEIVGVAADAKEHRVDERARPRFYANLFHPIGTGASVTLLVNGFGQPATLRDGIRHALQRIDPMLPVLAIRTVNEQIDRRLVSERLIAEISVFFGALAVLMAAIGLYGVMSYAMSGRTSEIGLRMALGASKGSVLWMVLCETLWLLAAGIAIGLPGALAAGRLISNRLFGLTPANPLAIATAILVISATTLIAGYVPARRAARVDPMVALRYD